MRKILHGVVNGVSILLIVCALFVLLTVVFTRQGETPSVLGFSVFRVLSGSMEPAIHTDDMILVRRVAADAVQVGDVITFYSSDPMLGGAVNTHRVTAILEGGDGPMFETRGDANDYTDIYPVYAPDLLGKVVGRSAILGKLLRLITNPLIFVPLILLPLLGMLIANMLKTVRLARQAVREEEAQMLEELVRQKQQDKSGKGVGS